MKVCFWCREPLKFIRGKGWLHLDGKIHRTKKIQRGGKEIEVDDHYALPVDERDLRERSYEY